MSRGQVLKKTDKIISVINLTEQKWPSSFRCAHGADGKVSGDPGLHGKH